MKSNPNLIKLMILQAKNTPEHPSHFDRNEILKLANPTLKKHQNLTVIPQKQKN